ncbi:transposon Tn21 resolvase (plasmid) [Arthrobacter sp. Hiyo8]|nr:transposon Tn21 resolvase [Arthrobacter sp. Hiyo8]
MPGQRIGYIRVSNLDQKPQPQLAGVQLDRIFADKSSGKDVKRPNSRSCCPTPEAATPSSCTAWTVSPETSSTCAP